MDLRWFYGLIATMSFLRQSDPSRVIDSSVTKGLYVSDYCPFMKGCAKPGIHVMCLRNPNVINWFGPHCHEAKNITVTDQIALRLLTIVNAIRRKVALGIERGKDGRYFPRGYGIWKLEWDSELATFAQVWANQCVFHRDYCRATAPIQDRFPNPSQSLGLVRFTYPDWRPITTSWPGTGFQPQIIVHAVIQTVKKWYTMKNDISVDQIHALPNTSITKPYLNMVSSDVTHMGCGISAFTEYSYNAEDVDLLYNSVLLVCNFSARLNPETAVYNTTPPTTSEYTKCGCPPGSKEDEDCLCYLAPENKTCSGPQCKSTVVLLPIFTVQDAPSGLIPKLSSFNNITRARAESMEVFKLFKNLNVFNNDSVNEGSTNFNKSLRFHHGEANNRRQMQEMKAIEHALDLNYRDDYFVRRNAVNKSNKCSSWESKKKYEVINPTKQFGGINIGIRRKVIDKTRERNDSAVDIANTAKLEDKAQRFSLLEAGINKQNDNKLAELLNKLELAVDHVDLDSSKRQLFDEKIKKIYNNLLQKIPGFNNGSIDKYQTSHPKNVRYENENKVTRKNHNPYHDESYLENDAPETELINNSEKDFHSNQEKIKLSKTRKLVANTNNYESMKRHGNSDQMRKLNNPDKQFVFMNRVVKDDAINVNRRMYYQNRLAELEYNKPGIYSTRVENNYGINRMRPTIN